MTDQILYLECNMGAAGDMLMAALYELLPDRDGFLHTMNHLGLPGVHVSAEPAVRCGITGTHITVTVHGMEEDEHLHCHGHHHHHSTLADICHVIDHMPVSNHVKEQAKCVYHRIASAESRVHGETVEAVHFHEVGAWDAVADVVGVCLAMEQLSPRQVVVSPVHVGCGQVRCAHGILPVPAPATALLLQGVPIYGGEVRGELCTPTGAALLTHFADRFGSMPVMQLAKIGCGMGTKEFERANCVRAMVGNVRSNEEEISELSCNLDDMTPEDLAYAQEQLLEAGALDVFTTAIGMKKNRPGIMLTCLCQQEDEGFLAQLMLQHTTTLGVRVRHCSRYTLSRSVETVDTPYGPIRVKTAEGFGIRRSKAEYEDVAKAAKEHNVPISEVRKSL